LQRYALLGIRHEKRRAGINRRGVFVAAEARLQT
jgi:hypothetical protein